MRILLIAPAVLAALMANAANAARIELPPLAEAKQAVRAAASGGVQQIGVERSIDAATSAAAMQAMQWNRTPEGGLSGRISVAASGAAALRVGIAVRAPPGAMLKMGPAPAVDARAAVEATRRWGLYWGPVSSGGETLIEMLLPAGMTREAVALSVRSVSHLSIDPAHTRSAGGLAKSAGSCERDVMCVAQASPALQRASRAVAKIVYTRDGATYACTGTLVEGADAAARTPFMITAKHCIDSPAVAATVNSYWFLEARHCGEGDTPVPVTLASGANLEYASAVNDVSVLRLAEPAPAGAGFVRIDAAAMAMGDSAVALHHPQGGTKKISTGIVVDPEGVAGRSVAVSWLVGTTEPGSSGSGLFSDHDGEYRLRGVLRGGSASCENSGELVDPANRDIYARLDPDIDALAKMVRLPGPERGDYSDLWAVTNDPANGITIAQRPSGAVFAVWFTYDGAGNPAWLMMPAATWSGADEFSGTVHHVARPGAVADVKPVGEALFSFQGRDNGTVRLRLGGGPERVLQIRRHDF